MAEAPSTAPPPAAAAAAAAAAPAAAATTPAAAPPVAMAAAATPVAPDPEPEIFVGPVRFAVLFVRDHEIDHSLSAVKREARWLDMRAFEKA